jgi:hypothetical protein
MATYGHISANKRFSSNFLVTYYNFLSGCFFFPNSDAIMLQILPGTQIEPGRNQSPVRQLKTNSVRSRSQSYGAYKPTCTWSRIVPSCTCRLPSCVSLTGKTRTNHRHRGFWSRSKKWRCWEDERGRGCRSQRRSRRGSRAAGSAAAGHGEGSVGIKRSRGRCCRGMRGGAWQGKQGRLGGAATGRQPAAATTVLQRHVRDREVRDQ